MRYHEASMPTQIKRYSNRKLYDVEMSRYVTTDELAFRIRNGETVVVTDHETEEDLTVSVLSTVLKRSDLSPALLHQMIRFGSTHVEAMLEQARRGISDLQQDVRDRDMDELDRKIEELETLIAELVGQIDETQPG